MTLNFTDILDPTLTADVDAATKQFLPVLTNGTFIADNSALSAPDQTFAAAVKWYGELVANPTFPNTARDMWIELVNKCNTMRDIGRILETYVMVFNRMIHHIFGVEEDTYSVGEVPTYTYCNWELKGVTQISATQVDLTVKYVASSGTDPRSISSTSYVPNPDFGSPGEPEFNPVTTGFALPNGGIVKITRPSKLQYHGGLILYKVGTDAQTVADGGNFTLHCLGTMSSLALEKFPADDAGLIYATVQFYSPHVAEQWTLPKDHYPFFSKQVNYSIVTPTAAVLDVVALRAWPFSDENTGIISYSDKPDVTFNPNAFLQISHVSTTAYKTQIDMTAWDMTNATTLALTLWMESTDGDATLMGQNRCANSLDDWSNSWGLAGTGCSRVCALRQTASGAANFRVGHHVSGGCFQHGVCDGFAQNVTVTNPMDAIRKMLAAIPWKLVQILVGDDATILTRLECPSLASECGLMLTLPVGLHITKDFTLNSNGFLRRKILSGVLYADNGLYWLTGDAQPVPASMTNSSLWPDAGMGNNVWTKTPEYPAATDPDSLMASMVTASDWSAHPYTLDSRSEYFGKYLRFFDFTLLFDNIPADGNKLWLDGYLKRGSWTFAAQNYVNKFTLNPFRVGRFQRGWGGAGQSATIKHAEFLGGNLIALYLQNGVQSASTHVGGVADSSTSWRQCGMNVALPEYLQVRNSGSDCSVGVDRIKMHPGQTASIDNTLPSIWITQAAAGWTGSGAQTDSWKVTGAEPGTEDEYYASIINIHLASFPLNHKDRANKMDRIVVYDEGGEWQARGASWFVDKTLTVNNDGVALSSASSTVSFRDAEAGMHYYFQAAQGDLYTTAIADGNTMAIVGQFASYMQQVLTDEIKAAKKVLINALS